MPNKPVFIYGLYDARTLSIRYVGKTHDLKQRLRLHMMRARDKKATVNPRFLNWVRLLTEAVPNPRRWDTTGPYIAGLLGCVVLEVTDNENWESAERKWIADIRPHGGLLNIATGGNGPTFNTAETRRRMSEAHRGKKHTPETRQAIADGQRGNRRGPATRLKLSLSATRRGTAHMNTAAARAAKSKTLTGRIYSPETIECMRVAAHARYEKYGPNKGMTGKKHSEETKLKMRAAHARRKNA